VLRKAGIIRGRFINFHPRDKSALTLAVAKSGDSPRRLNLLKALVARMLDSEKDNLNIYDSQFYQEFYQEMSRELTEN